MSAAANPRAGRDLGRPPVRGFHADLPAIPTPLQPLIKAKRSKSACDVLRSGGGGGSKVTAADATTGLFGDSKVGKSAHLEY